MATTTGPTTQATGFDAARLIECHQAGVWRYLRVLGCDPGLADDLTHDTFLAVLQKPFDDFSTAATAAYLRRVAYNLFISHRRRAKKSTFVEHLEIIDNRFVQWAGDDNGQAAIDALRECLQRLGPRARRSLEMRFRDGSSRGQIAEELAITEHGAKNLMQRAKQQLRECVEGKISETGSR
jgi:RNA polymerase sigma-70 factor (ECF subfamily)